MIKKEAINISPTKVKEHKISIINTRCLIVTVVWFETYAGTTEAKPHIEETEFCESPAFIRITAFLHSKIKNSSMNSFIMKFIVIVN